MVCAGGAAAVLIASINGKLPLPETAFAEANESAAQTNTIIVSPENDRRYYVNDILIDLAIPPEEAKSHRVAIDNVPQPAFVGRRWIRLADGRHYIEVRRDRKLVDARAFEVLTAGVASHGPYRLAASSGSFSLPHANGVAPVRIELENTGPTTIEDGRFVTDEKKSRSVGRPASRARRPRHDLSDRFRTAVLVFLPWRM
ncbi:MAG: hypothetical protein M5R36_27615 [Deltaproteobacteria bacterium]|nr:hypothetical protein [Deltaproteobacteria bacterium]